MSFKLRRFLDSVPWAEWGVVLGGLLTAVALLYAMEDGKSRKKRCPTCNQIIRKTK